MKMLLVVGLGMAGFLGMAEGEPVDAGRRIEYVEARLQDEQCFDTGVPLKTTTRIVMDFQYSVNPGNTSQFSGASYFNPGFMWGVHEGYFAFHDPVEEYVKTSVPVDASRHVYDLASGLQKLDGKEVATVVFKKGNVDKNPSSTSVAPIYLFGYMGTTMAARGFSTMRLYGCQIYDGSTLVRDYVPWMRGGVAGLYDRVHDRFGICFTKAQLMGPMYHDIAYVESDGNEYVDTGYVPTSKTKVVLDCQYLTTTVRQLQGVNDSATTTDFGWGIDAGYFRTYEWTATTQVWRGWSTADTNRHVFTFEDGSQTIDGKECSTARMAVGNAGTAKMRMYLFARRLWEDAPQNNCIMRLFGCQIYEGGTLKRDYRPCSMNGVAGLMETVSSNFVHLSCNVGTKMRCSPGATGMIDCAAIEMVGSQFLDTGVTPTKQTRMVLDCRYTALPSSGTRYLAGVNSNSGHYDFSWGINENGKFVTYMVAPGTWQVGPTADAKRHVWDLGPGLQKIDETVIATQTSVDNPTKGIPIYLGARHTLWAEGTPEQIAPYSAVAEPNCVRIYGCRFYEGNALTHDLVPCFCEGNAGLRDKVTGAFLPIEAQTAGRRSGGIFAPFAEEVYDSVKSDGGLYVDTEVGVSDKLKVVLDCQYRNVSVRQLQGYDNNATVDFTWGVDSGYFRTFNCKNGAWAGNAKADQKRHVFTIENGLQTIDGEDYTTAAVRGTNPNSDQVLYLFARLLTWSPLCQNHCFMRLYSSQIYSNGELVRDFVPARVLGFTCLYDRVNNRPYLPHGGDFILPQQGMTVIIR